jgi:opacity protein-like surface antigen
MMMRTFAFAAALAALALPAAAADAPAPTAQSICKGDVTRVRHNKLKPGATMADFDAAVAAHRAWYKSRGYKLTIVIAPVLHMQNGVPMVSKDEVMSFASGDNVPRDRQDKGWGDFVAKYRASSDMTLEQIVCMPKHG